MSDVGQTIGEKVAAYLRGEAPHTGIMSVLRWADGYHLLTNLVAAPYRGRYWAAFEIVLSVIDAGLLDPAELHLPRAAHRIVDDYTDLETADVSDWPADLRATVQGARKQKIELASWQLSFEQVHLLPIEDLTSEELRAAAAAHPQHGTFDVVALDDDGTRMFGPTPELLWLSTVPCAGIYVEGKTLWTRTRSANEAAARWLTEELELDRGLPDSLS